ncbi:hypothetical protein D3C73_1268370 [compost metagenome]
MELALRNGECPSVYRLFQPVERTASVRQNVLEAKCELRKSCGVRRIIILLEEQRHPAFLHIEVFFRLKTRKSASVSIVIPTLLKSLAHLGVQHFLVIRIGSEQITEKQAFAVLQREGEPLPISPAMGASQVFILVHHQTQHTVLVISDNVIGLKIIRPDILISLFQ